MPPRPCPRPAVARTALLALLAVGAAPAQPPQDGRTDYRIETRETAVELTTCTVTLGDGTIRIAGTPVGDGPDHLLLPQATPCTLKDKDGERNFRQVADWLAQQRTGAASLRFRRCVYRRTETIYRSTLKPSLGQELMRSVRASLVLEARDASQSTRRDGQGQADPS